jgi:hypothetical protein
MSLSKGPVWLGFVKVNHGTPLKLKYNSNYIITNVEALSDQPFKEFFQEELLIDR